MIYFVLFFCLFISLQFKENDFKYFSAFHSIPQTPFNLNPFNTPKIYHVWPGKKMRTIKYLFFPLATRNIHHHFRYPFQLKYDAFIFGSNLKEAFSSMIFFSLRSIAYFFQVIINSLKMILYLLWVFVCACRFLVLLLASFLLLFLLALSRKFIFLCG